MEIEEEKSGHWENSGSHLYTRAGNASQFVRETIEPLFYNRTVTDPTLKSAKEIISEREFWERSGGLLCDSIRISGVRLSDWFPRAPGLFWSGHARRIRRRIYEGPARTDPKLGDFVDPGQKASLIEECGIGTIRLRPRRIDNEYCWLATALNGRHCHGGIPLVIPVSLMNQRGITWGESVRIKGRVRFLQDAGLDDTASRVHHSRPLILFVEEIEPQQGSQLQNAHTIITPVALFEPNDHPRHHCYDGGYLYTFVQCMAGSDDELDGASAWIEDYAKHHQGRVVTNYDEQRPNLADAPLSYQKLLAKTYDRVVIERFGGDILANRVDVLDQSITTITHHNERLHVGHDIKVIGPAIINIDAILENVTQTINNASGLAQEEKSKLEPLVQTIKTELDRIKAEHVDEAQAIADALEKAVANASKPSQERKKSILELSAKGLKDAAELVKDISPTVLKTAAEIAKFIVGL